MDQKNYLIVEELRSRIAKKYTILDFRDFLKT